MEKFLQPSQLAKMVFFLLLLFIIPFIPASMRTSYLYFILNILIVVLGVEAGFLAAISGPPHDEKIKPATPTIAKETLPQPPVLIRSTHHEAFTSVQSVAPPVEPVQSVVEKKAAVPRAVSRMKKCPSMPSIFFICSSNEVVEEEEEAENEVEMEVEEEEEEEEEEMEMEGDQLFTKAEMFIGNFYKQLKMQRENSWKKIHELYHRAF